MKETFFRKVYSVPRKTKRFSRPTRLLYTIINRERKKWGCYDGKSSISRSEKGRTWGNSQYCRLICLSILKLVVGYLADSEALKADGLNNATDIISSFAVLIGLKLSQRPADDDHPYGHWKAENVASLVASFIMMVVGIQVVSKRLSAFIKEPMKPLMSFLHGSESFVHSSCIWFIDIIKN